MKSTCYAHAIHLEGIGDISGAIKAYEQADAHQTEVPRMLFELERLQELEGYVNRSSDKALNKWWAGYCESVENHGKALDCYKKCAAYLSVVRIHCYRNEFQDAINIVNETEDPAAAFHLAKQYELLEKPQEAISYYSKAKRYNHAARVARKYDLDRELMNMTLQSYPADMLETAAYFESREHYEKAVLLYQKGGNVSKAIDLSFKTQQFESLRQIAESLGENSDPQLLARCGECFMQHEQYEKAVQLFIAAGKIEQALELCSDKSFNISEKMADQMTPQLSENPTQTEKTRRQETLLKIAKFCKQQGAYHLACKKYTQAGDKLKAMKVLLKSGDTEKIIFFAGVSRQKDIYIVAANYLQSLDWHNNQDVMKAIINFYTKARAMDSLSTFYEACSQIEIDEYRDYEKALGALMESKKYLNKARVVDKDDRIAMLQQRIGMVDSFVQARKLVKTDPTQMVSSTRTSEHTDKSCEAV